MRIAKITSDPFAFIMGYLFAFHSKTIRLVSTGWCRIKMRLWGIKFGKKCSFRGNMLFFRGNGSSIVRSTAVVVSTSEELTTDVFFKPGKEEKSRLAVIAASVALVLFQMLV